MNRLGPYEVGEELARGAMGVVYRARDSFLDRPLALKVIGADAFDPEGQERFRREALVLARLRHTRIVAVHGAGLTSKGQPYLVMDLVSGGSLSQRLQSGPLPPREAVRLATQVAEATAYAHTQGVLHRDIKPANVLIDDSGDAVLSDFGLAKLVGEKRLTQTGDILGTPSYMAPEQVRGNLDYTPAVDVYALGATLYRALTGRTPLEAPTTTELFMKVLEEAPPPASQFVAGVDEELEEILVRSLAKDPTARYRRMEDFLSALRGWRDKSMQDTVAVTQVGAAQARTRSRRLRIATAALGSLILGLVVGTGIGLAGAEPLERSQRAWRAPEELAPELLAAHDRGRARLDRDDFVGAKEDFLRVTEAAPACDAAWLGLGRTLVGLEEEGALEALRRATALDPMNAAAWLEVGKEHVKEKRYADAVTALQKAVAANPHGAAHRISLAVALQAAGRKPEAQLAWQESCRLDPRRAENAVFEAVYNGLTEEQQIEVLERALKTDATNEELLMTRARIYNKADRFPEAIEAYTDVLRNYISDRSVLKERGMVYLSQRKFPEGIGDFGVALELEPDDTSVKLIRGVALFKRGRYAHALPDLEAVSEKGTDEERAMASSYAKPIHYARTEGNYVLTRRLPMYASLQDGEIAWRVEKGSHVKLLDIVETANDVPWARITFETNTDRGKITGFVEGSALFLDVAHPE